MRLAGPWFGPREGTLIVLGGASLDGFPDENTMLRCMDSISIYREGAFRKVVVSGYRVAPHMRNILIAEGVPAEVVVTEEAAKSTHENALYVARLLAGETGPKVLLTSDYHMFRAVRTFRKAGIDVIPRPIRDALKSAGNPLRRWPALMEEVLETIKIFYYAYQGWI
jgi:uncharacterized SAM-binding protein YcdF (DUF218 family)